MHVPASTRLILPGLCRCPKNTLARKVLGGLKDRAEPVDLPVYPVKLQGSKVFVKFI